MKYNWLRGKDKPKILTHTRLHKHPPNLVLRESMVRHPLVPQIPLRNVRFEVQDEEHAAGLEARSQAFGGEERVVEVVETDAYACEVELCEGRGGEGFWVGV